MTTIETITDRIISRLEKGTTVLVNVLNGALTNSQDQVTLAYDLAGAGVGSVVEVGAEQMYVLEKAALVLTVIRGWNGTTKTAHLDAAVVRLNPRFERQSVIDLVEEELHSWPVELHRWDTVEVTVPTRSWKAQLDPTISGSTIHRLLDANLLDDSTDDSGQRSRIDVRFMRDADDDEFTSGYAIQLPHTFGETRTVQCDLITSYDYSTLNVVTTDLESDVGLRPELFDVLIYGVLWRSMSTMEVGRTNPAAAPSQDSAEVPPTHPAQTAAGLLTIRNQRLSEERTRIFDHWPILMTMMGS